MNRQPVIISLEGTGSDILSCPLPPIFRDSMLFRLKLGVSTMYLNNGNIPIFIPELITLPTLTYATTATSEVRIGDDWTVESLDYFIVLRNNDNSQAVVSFVQHSQSNGLIPPPSSIVGAESVYTTEYYYYFEFMDFVNSVYDAIAAAFNNKSLSTTGLSIIYDAESQTMNFSYASAIASAWAVEFSPKLHQLFAFQSRLTPYGTYRPLYPKLTLSIESVECVNTSAEIRDTIFPFDLFLINTNLPIQPTQIMSNRTGTNNRFTLQDPVMFTFRKLTPGLNIGSAFVAANPTQDSLLHSFTQRTVGRNMLSIKLILRTRRDKFYLPWSIPIGANVEFDLNVFEDP